MLKKKMLKGMNDQINAEMFSSYLYLSMENYFQSISLGGFAAWMRAQAQEEMMHAMKFYDYVNERGGKVTLEAIAKPETSTPSHTKVTPSTRSPSGFTSEMTTP